MEDIKYIMSLMVKEINLPLRLTIEDQDSIIYEYKGKIFNNKKKTEEKGTFILRWDNTREMTQYKTYLYLNNKGEYIFNKKFINLKELEEYLRSEGIYGMKDNN